MNLQNYWIVAYPDIPKPIGGIKQLHRVAEIISDAGRSCHLIQGNNDFRPTWFSSTASVISKADFFDSVKLSSSRDVLILPETYMPIVHNIVDPCIPRIIFNQNASYTFGMKSHQFFNPSDISSLYKFSSIKQIWCVSRYDQHFLHRYLSFHIDRVRLISNAIDVQSLPLRIKKRRQIVYMPRKNSEDSTIVRELFNNSELSSSWSMKPIVDLSHEEVIQLMQESLVFFSFGFPEGFGLPVAEAMACGCAVIGYDGLGGRELFKYASQYPNLSFPIPYGDWYAFVDCLRLFDHNLSRFQSEILHNLGILSSVVRQNYNYQSMKHDVTAAIDSLDESI